MITITTMIAIASIIIVDVLLKLIIIAITSTIISITTIISCPRTYG